MLSESQNDSRTDKAAAELFAAEPFGFADMGRAIAHPLRFKPSLIFGGLIFMIFTLGQSVSALGGVLLLFVAVFFGIVANMLTFVILANTVKHFTQGHLDADFMPKFARWSLWDDVIHPSFLSIGVYVSSFGPFMVVALVGAYLLAGAADEQAKKYNDELARLPGTQFYSPNRTAEQSQQVKEVLDEVKRQNARRHARQKRLAESAESGIALPNESDDLSNEGNAAIDHPGTPENLPQAALDTKTRDESFRETVTGILRLAAPLVVVGTLALLWGLFYFPAACSVAAYSRSFMAAINPVVGLDAIKKLGLTYIKLLLMWLLIVTTSFATAFAARLILFPFELPTIGNLPAIALGSLITFYFWIVLSCLLGYALFKNSDRLKLYR